MHTRVKSVRSIPVIVSVVKLLREISCRDHMTPFLPIDFWTNARKKYLPKIKIEDVMRLYPFKGLVGTEPMEIDEGDVDQVQRV